MKILAFECSAGPASCAVWEDGVLLATGFTNVKLTHSQTLVPMADSVLKSAMLTLSDIDAFAIACGPGSFTGVRIGLAAVKGLAQPHNKPCVPVSTLAAMARRFECFEGTVCALMDARRDQFYNAVFTCKDGTVTRVCEDRAASIAEIEETLNSVSGNIILTGDGAKLFYSKTAIHKSRLTLPAPELLYQHAAGVAMEAAANYNPTTAQKLFPVYLRMSQAERELKEKGDK